MHSQEAKRELLRGDVTGAGQASCIRTQYYEAQQGGRVVEDGGVYRAFFFFLFYSVDTRPDGIFIEEIIKQNDN